jgi:hypothetical protein
MDVDSGVSGELNTLYYCNRAITAFGINSQVSLWQKAREFVPAPWFEAWFDYDPLLGKAVLYARRPPFSWEDWNAVHNSSGNIIDKIVPSDIVKEELGVNSSDVMSIFFPSMSGVFLGDDKITALYPPLISSRLMKKFGIVMFQPQVTFAKFSPDEHDTGDIFKMMDTLREQCAEWYSLCDEMESGSLTIKGRTDLRIGDKVRLYSSGNNSRDFYVEGVRQSWSLTSPWCTELTVTRGLPTGRLQQTKNEVAVMKAEFATVQHYTDDPTASGGQ